jgi:flagellar hook assembly protein FlgD
MDFPVNGFTGVNDFTKNQSFEVSQNYPNPAVNSTVVGINLQETSDVSLEIVNLTGQLVKSIDLGRTSAGVTNVTIDISDLSSGIYYYTVSANDEQITNKLIVR